MAFFLEDSTGVRAEWAALEGFYSIAGTKVGSWLDCNFYAIHSFDGRKADLAKEGLATVLFRALGEAITSHCMVAYEVWDHESELHTYTEKSYRLGIPPAVTPVGELLLSAGCVAGFKDWYIAEGGNEGPRKLQAEKPSSPEARTEALSSLARSFTTYLARPPVKGEREVERDCRARAVRLLGEMNWPEPVFGLAAVAFAAASEAKHLLRDGPRKIRKAIEGATPHWSLEDGP